MIQLTLTLKMTTAQVVETSVTVNNNRPIEGVHPDDHNHPTYNVYYSWATQKTNEITQNIKKQAIFLIMFSFGGRWSYGVVLYEIFTIGRWYFILKRICLHTQISIFLTFTHSSLHCKQAHVFGELKLVVLSPIFVTAIVDYNRESPTPLSSYIRYIQCRNRARVNQRDWQYRTLEAPLKLSNVYYNLTTYTLHTNL